MIPASFEYHRPKDMAGVLSILDEHGDDARVMAGGHSLIPMMKLRMADVPHLIDLQDVSGLAGITVGDTITIGAMVTQSDIILHDALADAAPILREASLQIADPQVRYMGTVGGNVANGDPGNDMPGLMQCLDATFTVVGPNGEREIPAREFYEAAYMTGREDDEALSKLYASLCDVYVMDAFGTAHRAQASTHGVGRFAPVSCAGPLLAAELDALGKALQTPKRPLVAIVGGSKVSTKLTVLESLSEKVDQLIVGGGIANTFLAAAGKPVGKSLYEADLLDNARVLASKTSIPTPRSRMAAMASSGTASSASTRSSFGIATVRTKWRVASSNWSSAC